MPGGLHPSALPILLAPPVGTHVLDGHLEGWQALPVGRTAPCGDLLPTPFIQGSLTSPLGIPGESLCLILQMNSL